MKKFISIFLSSLLVVLCFLYVFPLISLAETIFDSVIAFSVEDQGVEGNNFQLTNSFYKSGFFSLSSSFSTSTLNLSSTDSSARVQLPVPFSNLNNISYNPIYYSSVSVSGGGTRLVYLLTDSNNLTYHFSGIVNQLSPSSGDYVSFYFPVKLTYLPNAGNLNFQFFFQDSGNSWVLNNQFSVDDRFIIYDPYSIAVGSSGIINTSLFSDPGRYSSSLPYCWVVYYVNFLYDDIEPYLTDLIQSDLGISMSLGSQQLNCVFYRPLICSFSKLDNQQIIINHLSSIDDNVQHIVDVMDSGTSFPVGSSTPDYSTMNQLEDQISSIASDSSIWTGLNDGFGSVEIIQGLAWVGSFITSYYNGLPFLKSIFALIILFEIWSILNGTFFNREQDETEWVYHTREHGTDSRGKTWDIDRFSERYKK